MNFETFDITKNFVNNKEQKFDPKPKKEPIFPESFTGLLVGKPGSGKSSLLEVMLNLESCFKGKFDIVLIISPTRIGGITYNEEYWTKDFSIDWIRERVTHFVNLLDYIKQSKKQKNKNKVFINNDKVALKTKNKNKFSNEYFHDASDDGYKGSSESNEENNYEINEDDYDPEHSGLTDNNKTEYKALIVIDDKISDLKAAENNKDLQTLFFNRRGMIKNVCMNFLITSQTFKRFPLKFRNTLTFIIVFNVGPTELKSICAEHVYDNASRITQAIQSHYKQGSHNFVYIRFDKYCVFLNFKTIIS